MLDHLSSVASPAQARPGIMLVVFLVVAGFGLVADLAGKSWAFAPSSEPADLAEIAPGVLAGAQGRNYGTMFSLDGMESPSLPRIVPMVVGFIVVAMLLRGAFLDRNRWRPVHAIGGGLVFAGALGNQVDRLVLGYVRDYLILRLHPQGIFNTADVFMVVGVLLLLVTWTARRRPASVSLQPGLSQPIGAE